MGFFIFVWFISGIACSVLASKYNRNVGLWLVLGFVFGIFAIIALYIMEHSNIIPSGTEDAKRGEKQFNGGLIIIIVFILALIGIIPRWIIAPIMLIGVRKIFH